MTTDLPPPVADKATWCWWHGLGIGQSLLAIRRTHPAPVTFEQVRQHFALLSDRATSKATPA